MLHFSPFKTWTIIATVIIGIIFAMPNFFSKEDAAKAPSFVPSSQLNLGLDLQGGSHLLLQMNTKELLEQTLESLRVEVRSKVAEARYEGKRLHRKRPRIVKDQEVQIRITKTEHVAAAMEKLRELRQPLAGLNFASGAAYNLDIIEGEDGLITVKPTEQAVNQRVETAITSSIEVIRRRIDALGTTEPTIQRQGFDRILVQVPGLKDPKTLKDRLKNVAKLSFHLLDHTMSARDAQLNGVPIGSELVEDKDRPGQFLLLRSEVLLSGADLKYARPGRDTQNGNQPIIEFGFNGSGAKLFAEITRKNLKKPFAIVLDKGTDKATGKRDRQVITAPVIQTPILTGQGQISGSFTPQETGELSLLLKSGSLAASMEIVEERTVGASLGQDSIEAGKIASILGLVAVVVFILATYGLFGVFANLALFVNLALIVGALSLLQATLTLPGIAGIVLTIGMAVDANVLIFERIKEEIRSGKTTITAIDTGYSRAFGTILDANITTFIAAAILFLLGSGPIQGFAVTLAIGIVTSVFTACTFTRFIVAKWLGRQPSRTVKAPINGLNFIPHGTKINFQGFRKIAMVISGALVILSGVLFFGNGLNYGIDFKGGVLVEVGTKDNSPVDLAKLRSQVNGLGLGEVQVQSFGKEEHALIKVESPDSKEDGAAQKVVDKVHSTLEGEYDFRRDEVVGPTVSGELKQDGAIAVIIAIICVLIYIWARFEWQFSLGAVVALMHDVILTIGIFSLLGLEFGLSIVAALLTIVGYSLNDTVVVYDRIRENLRKYKKKPLVDVLNLSINETLSRTILTSVTTLLALMALYIFGGEVLRGFIFAMIWGVLVGTYSSVFIASPILLVLGVKRDWSAEGSKTNDNAATASV